MDKFTFFFPGNYKIIMMTVFSELTPTCEMIIRMTLKEKVR